MTFIPTNFDEAQEAKPAPSGMYQVQVVNSDLTETGPNSKHPGSPMFKVQIGFPENPNTPNFNHYVSIPSETDDADTARYKTLLLKRFLVAFNIPFENNGFEAENLAMDMIGATAKLEVELGEPNANGDVYNSLKVPRIRGESTGNGRATPPNRR